MCGYCGILLNLHVVLFGGLELCIFVKLLFPFYSVCSGFWLVVHLSCSFGFQVAATSDR